MPHHAGKPVPGAAAWLNQALTCATIGAAIQKFVEAEGFSVVREYCGHGIGRGFHGRNRQVLHYDSPETNVVLKPGMTFTIEPMVNAGKKIRTMKDGWTVKTEDRSLSAQYEHTIVVTDNGSKF